MRVFCPAHNVDIIYRRARKIMGFRYLSCQFRTRCNYLDQWDQRDRGPKKPHDRRNSPYDTPSLAKGVKAFFKASLIKVRT